MIRSQLILCTPLLFGTGAVEAQRDEWKTDFGRHNVPLEEIVSGGPPKDGIPAIDRPRFVSVAAADRWLSDPEPVVVVDIGPTARAYPLQILIWHEIVNDVIGETPVTVTFCPLCNTAIAFDRRLDGQLLDFGVSGRLRHSDMVMYDRQTESWWQQATGEALVGALMGSRLKVLSAPLVSWREFRRTWPDGLVLSRETGHKRSYGENPYALYDRPGGAPIRGFIRGTPDRRLAAMERMIAIRLGDEAVAHPFSALARDTVRHDALGDTPLVIWWAPGTASAVDARTIARGRDVGSSGVFDARIDGTPLRFRPHGPGRFQDIGTTSTWDVFGRAVAGPLRGKRLTAIPHGNHFWFAWSVFQPNARLVP